MHIHRTHVDNILYTIIPCLSIQFYLYLISINIEFRQRFLPYQFQWQFCSIFLCKFLRWKLNYQASLDICAIQVQHFLLEQFVSKQHFSSRLGRPIKCLSIQAIFFFRNKIFELYHQIDPVQIHTSCPYTFPLENIHALSKC